MNHESSPMYIAGRLAAHARFCGDETVEDLLWTASELLARADAVLRLCDADIAEWRAMDGTSHDSGDDEDVRAAVRRFLSGDTTGSDG